MDKNNAKNIIMGQITDDASKEKSAKSALNLLFKKYISRDGDVTGKAREFIALLRITNPKGVQYVFQNSDNNKHLILLNDLLSKYEQDNYSHFGTEFHEQIKLFANAFNKLAVDYLNACNLKDDEKKKEITSSSSKLINEIFSKIGLFEFALSEDIRNDSNYELVTEPLSKEILEDLSQIFGKLDISCFKNNLYDTNIFETVRFFTDFLEISRSDFNNGYAKDFISRSINDFLDILDKNKALEERIKSAYNFHRAIDICLIVFTKNLSDGNLKEIELIRNYMQKLVNEFEFVDDEEKEEHLSKLLNVFKNLRRQYSKLNNISFGFNQKHSLVDNMKEELEKEFGVPLNLLLVSQDITSYKADDTLSNDDMLKKLVNKKKENLSESEKKEKANEVLSLSRFLSENHPGYHEGEEGKIESLIDIFVYLDIRDLRDSTKLEIGMAKITEFVKIFNDAVSKLKEPEDLKQDFLKGINFFSKGIQKAVNEKNYTDLEIYWYKFKSILKLIVTFGLSKDAKEEFQQPLLKARKSAFRSARNDLKKQLNDTLEKLKRKLDNEFGEK